MDDFDIAALVAVKGHSERVKDKNVRPFCNSSLLELKIRQLKRIFDENHIIVNTDSEYIKDIACDYGVEYVMRNPYYAKSTTCMSEVYSNMASNVDHDFIAYTNVTNPLVSDKTMIDAIETFELHYGLRDSLVSCKHLKEYMWKDGTAINYNPSHHTNSQNLPKIYGLNFAVSILPKITMVERGSNVGYSPYFYEMDEVESLDIDTPLDFEFAEFMYKKLYMD